jgi:hypothetical protein
MRGISAAFEIVTGNGMGEGGGQAEAEEKRNVGSDNAFSNCMFVISGNSGHC